MYCQGSDVGSLSPASEWSLWSLGGPDDRRYGARSQKDDDSDDVGTPKDNGDDGGSSSSLGTDVDMSDELAVRRLTIEHEFLDFAKRYDWIRLAAHLKWDPDLVNAHPCKRWTALHQAARSGETSVVEWLLYARADPCRKNKEGRRPLALTTNPEIANLLKSAAEGRFPAVAPPTPTLVGGYLPHADGGSLDDYYYPFDKYSYQQTTRGYRSGAAASSSSSSAAAQPLAPPPPPPPPPGWSGMWPPPVKAPPVKAPPVNVPPGVALPVDVQALPVKALPVKAPPGVKAPPSVALPATMLGTTLPPRSSLPVKAPPATVSFKAPPAVVQWQWPTPKPKAPY
jgi:hypothetical protein